MKKILLLLAVAGLVLPAVVWADANVSGNPPAYGNGNQPNSMTPSGGQRSQEQDGAGNDVSTSHPFPVTSTGGPASTTTETTGTITLTGTYQLAFAANTARKGCLIQNTGGHAMLVFFGVTKPTASSGVGFSLEAADSGVDGGSISCGLIGGGVLTDNVWIEGTTSDTFEQASQP